MLPRRKGRVQGRVSRESGSKQEQSCEGEGEGGAGRRGVEVTTKPELGEKSFQSREIELREGDCRLQALEIMLSPLQNLKLLGSIASTESWFQVGLCDLHSV